MNVICWNCRGTASKGFAGLIKDIRSEFSCSLMFLVETHTSGSLAKRIAKRCGLDQSFIVDARGQSSGLWCIWDSIICKVQILNSTSQLIHLRVQFKNNSPWFLTACYGSPHFAQRQDLWHQFRDIHADLYSPWALLGDLNTIINIHEREGPPLTNPPRYEQGLMNAINQCELLDAGFVSDPFTWERDGTKKRLDRMLINLNWRMRIPEVEVHHLPFYKSSFL